MGAKQCTPSSVIETHTRVVVFTRRRGLLGLRPRPRQVSALLPPPQITSRRKSLRPRPSHLRIHPGPEERHVLLDALRLHPPLERGHLRLEHHGESQLAVWLNRLQNPSRWTANERGVWWKTCVDKDRMLFCSIQGDLMFVLGVGHEVWRRFMCKVVQCGAVRLRRTRASHSPSI